MKINLNEINNKLLVEIFKNVAGDKIKDNNLECSKEELIEIKRKVYEQIKDLNKNFSELDKKETLDQNKVKIRAAKISILSSKNQKWLSNQILLEYENGNLLTANFDISKGNLLSYNFLRGNQIKDDKYTKLDIKSNFYLIDSEEFKLGSNNEENIKNINSIFENTDKTDVRFDEFVDSLKLHSFTLDYKIFVNDKEYDDIENDAVKQEIDER